MHVDFYLIYLLYFRRSLKNKKFKELGFSKKIRICNLNFSKLVKLIRRRYINRCPNASSIIRIIQHLVDFVCKKFFNHSFNPPSRRIKIRLTDARVPSKYAVTCLCSSYFDNLLVINPSNI